LINHPTEKSSFGWTILSLPAIAPEDADIEIGEGRIHHRKAGDVLHPEREPREALDEVRRSLGSEAFQAQYQQCPVPPGGNMFHRDRLRYYDLPFQAAGCGEVIQSWDTASKVGAPNDYSVCTTWLVAGGHYYLLDLIRGKFEYPLLRSTALAAAERWGPRRVLIEDAGVGTGLISDLRGASISAIGVRASVGKIERADIVTPMFQSGRVLFPRKAPWLSALLAELLAFPSCRNDDQVDSIVQMLGFKLSTLTVRIRTY
jgi:predicted phage terminase large subunit-like protein